jgi:hypothetical protein
MGAESNTVMGFETNRTYLQHSFKSLRFGMKTLKTTLPCTKYAVNAPNFMGFYFKKIFGEAFLTPVFRL